MTTDTHDGPPAARFRFKGRTLDVELEGAEAFVSAQVEHLGDAIQREIAPEGGAPAEGGGESAGAGGDAGGDAGDSGAQSLEDFYRRAKSREGRGALQETILIFAYFLKEYRDKGEFSIENLNACFSLVGVTPPKSLANTLGIMKRNQKFFDSGARRGQYALTDKGIAYVKRLVGA